MDNKIKYVCEYVWIDGINQLRSKIRVIDGTDDLNIRQFDDFIWNYDGSSTYQAKTECSEVLLIPVQVYPNLLLQENYMKFVPLGQHIHYKFYYFMCKTESINGNDSSFYEYAERIFANQKVIEAEPWFGLEQEYFFVEPLSGFPIGFAKIQDGIINQSEPDRPQGDYYCGVGGNNIMTRNIAEKHMFVCLETGIQISGINAEVAYAQWEFQIGPVCGIEVCHQMWIARYILKKIAEGEGLDVTFEPKPITWGDWNGSGCHTNFSTKAMRDGMNGRTGMQYIMDAMKRLRLKHEDHMKVYGTGNELRLTGKHETSSMHEFSWDIGSRNTSVRIGYDVERRQKGYFEDRRPSSNMNPYLVCAKLCETILVEEGT